MEKQGGSKNNLKHRSYLFSLQIIYLLKQLSSNYIYNTIYKQLLRSATSVGANIVEAQAGRTKKDFSNFYQISLKSSNEIKYWLCLLRDTIQNDIIKQKITKNTS